MNSILVPTDGSDGARIGARRGINLAATLGTDLHVLSAVDTRDVEPHLQSHDQTERERLLEEEAERAVDYVDTHDIDFIAMGTHGRAGLRRYLIGSVTETVVRTATVPVCCVPMR